MRGDRLCNPANFGVKFVAKCIVRESRTLAERPELVKRFLTTLVAGWQQTIGPKNQEEAGKTPQKYDPDTPRPILKEQL
ncbi:MAG: hypothetical protein V2B20_18595 [Pseudomonadota bacterium]